MIIKAEYISITDEAILYLTELLRKNNPETLSCKLMGEHVGTSRGQTMLVYYEKEDINDLDILTYDGDIKIYIDFETKKYLKDTTLTLEKEKNKIIIKSPHIKITPDIESITELSELHNKSVKLLEDCEGVLIPHGTPVNIPKDSIVVITQALGRFFTVYHQGKLIRLHYDAGKLLGLTDLQLKKKSIIQPTTLTQLSVAELLKECYDPEIPVNIVDLGLVYKIELLPKQAAEKEIFDINIEMTLTALGCSMGDFIIIDVKDTLGSLDVVDKVNVKVVFEPAWSKDMMSEVAKVKLGMI